MYILKAFKNAFLKTIDFVKNLEMMQIAGAGGEGGGGGGRHALRLIVTQCMQKSICDSSHHKWNVLYQQKSYITVYLESWLLKRSYIYFFKIVIEALESVYWQLNFE